MKGCRNMKKKLHCFKAMTALFIISMLLTTFLSAAPAWAIGGGVMPGDMSGSIFDAITSMLNRDDYETDRDYLTAEVLAVLNDQTYADTLKNLNNGEQIISGSYSYTRN